MTPTPTLFVEYDPERLLEGLRGDGRFTWGCAHKRVNDRDPDLDDSLRDPYPQAVLKRFADGQRFEADVFAAICATANDVVVIDDSDYTAQIELTLAAIAAGRSVILGGALPTTSRRSLKPDVLVRHDVDGQAYYLPVDVKSHRGLHGESRARTWPCSSFDQPGFDARVDTDMGRGKPHLKDSLQLSHYWLVLSELGFAPPVRPVGGIIGKELTIVWRFLDEPLWSHPHPVTGERQVRSALDVYQMEWDFRWDAVHRVLMRHDGADVELLTEAEWKAECQECPWRTVCHNDLKERNHVTLLAGVTVDKARRLRARGVTSVADLARLHPLTAELVSTGLAVGELRELARVHPDVTPISDVVTSRRGVDTLASFGITTCGELAAVDPFTATMPPIPGLVDLIDTARARLAGTSGKVLLRRGVQQLTLPRADIEVDVDMENDPAGDPALVYLWGTWTTVRVRDMKLPDPQYVPFATWNQADVDGEAEAFAALWKYLHGLISVADTFGLTFRAYCYTDAEARCMRSLARRHQDHPEVPSLDEVETFLASDYWVDMARPVKTDLIWPTEDRKLKSVAKWARHQWRAEDASGDNSTVWYHTAVTSTDDAERQAAIDKLLGYNEDDVKATFVLRNWLTASGTRLPHAESLDASYARRRTRR